MDAKKISVEEFCSWKLIRYCYGMHKILLRDVPKLNWLDTRKFVLSNSNEWRSGHAVEKGSKIVSGLYPPNSVFGVKVQVDRPLLDILRENLMSHKLATNLHSEYEQRRWWIPRDAQEEYSFSTGEWHGTRTKRKEKKLPWYIITLITLTRLCAAVHIMSIHLKRMCEATQFCAKLFWH